MANIKKRPTKTKGVRWDAQVYVGTRAGKPVFRSKTFDRKKDADAWARDMETKRSENRLKPHTHETLGEFLERWLSTVKRGQVRDSTLEGYRHELAMSVLDPQEGAPPLAEKKIHKLTRDDFRRLYRWMQEERELHPRTIRYSHTLLRQALEWAVQEGILGTNPTDHVKPPKPPEDLDEGHTIRAMTEQEAARFLEAAQEDRLAAFWILLLTGGLRPSEAAGLLWKDVDLERGRIHVRASLTRKGVPKFCACGHSWADHGSSMGPCEEEGCSCERYEATKGWKRTPPKTKKGQRVVPLPGLAIEALRRWRVEQKRERLRVGPEWTEHGFVFTSEFGTPVDTRNLSGRGFRDIMGRAGLGEWGPVPEKPRSGPTAKRDFRPAFRVYDLRHTCATLLLKRGVAAKVVSERLGHASITLTLDTYSHVLPDMQETAVEALEAAFG